MLGAVVGVVVYRLFVTAIFYQLSANAEVAGQEGSSLGDIAATTTATTLNLIFIIVLNWVIKNTLHNICIQLKIKHVIV